MKTTKYICKNCRKEFENPNTAHISYQMGAPTVYDEIAVCPHCNCSGFEQIEKKPDKSELKQYIHLKKEIDSELLRLSTMKENQKGYTELYEMIENNKLRCMALLIRLQGFIYSIDDSLMRQIFELRYVEGLSWSAVAYKLGAYYTEDYVRIMHDRYLKRK